MEAFRMSGQNKNNPWVELTLSLTDIDKILRRYTTLPVKSADAKLTIPQATMVRHIRALLEYLEDRKIHITFDLEI